MKYVYRIYIHKHTLDTNWHPQLQTKAVDTHTHIAHNTQNIYIRVDANGEGKIEPKERKNEKCLDKVETSAKVHHIWSIINKENEQNNNIKAKKNTNYLLWQRKFATPKTTKKRYEKNKRNMHTPSNRSR